MEQSRDHSLLWIPFYMLLRTNFVLVYSLYMCVIDKAYSV